jgi:prepilin-type N-terminal cleavage/methylation domain-containing protein
MSSTRGGFTLVELLVALGIFAIALASLPALLMTSIKANALAARITAATNLAQDKLEVIRNTAYASVTSGSDVVTQSGTSFSRNWTLTAGPTTTTKKVAVTVSWTDQSSHQVELDHIITG